MINSAHDRNEHLLQRIEQLEAENRALRSLAQQNAELELALRYSEERCEILSRLSSDFTVGLVCSSSRTPQIAWATDIVFQTLGYSLVELKEGNLIQRLVHPQDLPDCYAWWSDLLKGESSELTFRILTRKGEVLTLRAKGNPILGNEDLVDFIYISGQDISGQEKKDPSLQKQAEIVETIFNHAPIMVALIDRNLQHQVVNREWMRVLGMTAEEAGAPDLIERLYPDPVYREEIIHFIRTGGPQWREMVTINGKGKQVHTSWVNMPLSDGSIISIGKDRTAQVESERSLRQSEERFRALIEKSPVGIGMSHRGQVFYANQALADIFGFPQPEAMKGINGYGLFAPEKRDELRRRNEARERHEDVPITYETLGCRADGSVFPMLMQANLIDLDNQPTTLFFVRDITEQKAALKVLQESERRFRLLYESAPLGYQSLDRNARFLTVNKTWLQVMGYRIEEVIGRWFGDFMTPESGELVKQRFPYFLEHGEVDGVVFEMVRKDESTFLASFTGRLGYDEQGQMQQTHCIFVDVTEQKHTEEIIREALEEKEIMLREIHHRVKNNLQVMISLLSLRAATLNDPNLRAAFDDSKDRIRTMALVHEELYRSKDLSRVDFGRYIERLTNDLFYAYQQNANIRLSLDVDELYISVDKAIPCGLVVNELVTNALKHAFPNSRSGEVKVSLKTNGSQVKLSVKDNGIGIPNGLDLRTCESLGMQLVHILSGQLRGNVTVKTESGTLIELVFPA